MAMIQANEVTFYYDGSHDPVLDHVSFQMDTSWRLGCIGRNGRGKTTLLRLLMGEFEYQGQLSAPADFAYFPYEVQDEELAAWELAEQIYPECEGWMLERETSQLGVPSEALYRPFRTLSHGERTKVLLGLLFLREDRFLLIDEPTNHLDREARRLLGDYLKRKKGFILVSHDRSLLDQCIDHVLWLGREGITIQQGNFSSWWENKERDDKHEQAENDRLKKEVKRLEAAARRTGEWAGNAEKEKNNATSSFKQKTGLRVNRGFMGHKAAKIMKRAKSSELRKQRAVEEKSQLLKEIETVESLKLEPLKYHKAVLASANALSLSYGEVPVLKEVSFELRQGQRLALKGRNGAGKSSLIHLLRGELKPSGGEWSVAPNLKISYVPQDTTGLHGTLDAFIAEHELDEPLFLAILRKLDFSREQFVKPMEQFSAGQRKKVMLAKSLCEPAHLYLWDEPLNYIDVFSRMQLEQLLAEYQPTMVLVEHDETFLAHVATDILEL